jgi:hypothetical protein
LILALALALPAAGDTLRDAGFGDGSLIDSHGDYFYPQPDGTYLDTYGGLYVPGGADTIDNDFNHPVRDYGFGERDNPDWGQDADTDGLTDLHRRGSGPDDRGRSWTWDGNGDGTDRDLLEYPGTDEPRAFDAVPDSARSAAAAQALTPAFGRELPGMYMDVGTGYLELDMPDDGFDQPVEDALTGSEVTGGERAGISSFAPVSPMPSTGDYNPRAAMYRKKYFGNETGEVPKGLMDPDAPPSYEDALRSRARVHDEVLGPNRDYKPLIPFDRGQRLRP